VCNSGDELRDEDAEEDCEDDDEGTVPDVEDEEADNDDDEEVLSSEDFKNNNSFSQSIVSSQPAMRKLPTLTQGVKSAYKPEGTKKSATSSRKPPSKTSEAPKLRKTPTDRVLDALGELKNTTVLESPTVSGYFRLLKNNISNIHEAINYFMKKNRYRGS